MRKLLSTVALVAGLAPSLVLAQDAPGPKLPAMPSMDQKGSDDLSKPAGAGKPPALTTAPKPSGGDGPKTKPPVAKPPATKPSVAKPPVAKPPVAKPRPKAAKPLKGAGAKRAPGRSSRPGAKPRAGGHAPKARKRA